MESDVLSQPNENLEVTVIYQAEEGKATEDHFLGAKGVGMTQDGFFRVHTADGELVDYSIPRIVKRVTRIMEVSLV